MIISLGPFRLVGAFYFVCVDRCVILPLAHEREQRFRNPILLLSRQLEHVGGDFSKPLGHITEYVYNE